MSKTLLNGINEVLKRAQIVDSNSELTSLTSSANQVWIDIAIQVLNEVMTSLYDESGVTLPNELAESTITLATDDRDYALASDLVSLRFPLIDQTNGEYITEYPGGYDQLIYDQAIPANYTGLPLNAAIRSTDGELYLDRIPTSNENGRVYKYLYDKQIQLTAADHTFPFSDTVFWSMIPAAYQIFRREVNKEFDEGIFRMSYGKSARLLTKKQQNDSWLPVVSGIENATDPYGQ